MLCLLSALWIWAVLALAARHEGGRPRVRRSGGARQAHAAGSGGSLDVTRRRAALGLAAAHAAMSRM